MIGDNRNDVLAAKAAGVTSLLYGQGVGAKAAKEQSSDLIFESYETFADQITVFIGEPPVNKAKTEG